MAKQKKMERNKTFGTIMKWFVSGILNFVFRVKVHGKENVPSEGPFLLIANHVSVFDPLVIQLHVKPWVYWVAKRELFDLPVIGFVLRKVGVISFERETLDITALKNIISVVKSGGVIGIFPQGKRLDHADRDSVLPKSATAHLARRFNIPVVPVSIENGYHVIGKKRTQLHFGKPIDMASLPEDDDQATIIMMQRIFSVMGDDYDPVARLTS